MPIDRMIAKGATEIVPNVPQVGPVDLFHRPGQENPDVNGASNTNQEIRDGYIQGYQNDSDGHLSKLDYELASRGLPYTLRKVNPDLYDTTSTQNLQDYASEKFRYGLDRKDVIEYYYEDPLYPGFDLTIDDQSPLFATTGGLRSFLQTYSTIDEFKPRISLLDEFMNYLGSVINIGVGSSNVVKPYYVNKIGGLDKLNAKFVNYPEDKITIEFAEDVSMWSLYIAETYNNLVYSYRTGRRMLPANLTKFDLLIRIQDMRNFKIPNRDWKPEEDPSKMYRFNTSNSHIVYQLHDCEFDFTTSQNIPTEISQAGFGAQLPTPATVPFTITYKSVTRVMSPELIDQSLTIDNRSFKLITKLNSFDSSYSKTWSDSLTKDQDTTSSEDSKSWNKPTPMGTDRGLLEAQGLDRLRNRGQTLVNNATNEVLGQAQRSVQELRGQIINRAINEITDITEGLVGMVENALGFTLTKTNVYEDSVSDVIDNTLDLNRWIPAEWTDVSKKLFGSVDNQAQEIRYRNGNLYETVPSSNVGNPLGSIDQSTPPVPMPPAPDPVYDTNEPPVGNVGNILGSVGTSTTPNPTPPTPEHMYDSNEPPVVNIGNDLQSSYVTNEPPVVNIGNDLQSSYVTNEPPVVNIGNNLAEVYTTNEPPTTNIGNDLQTSYITNEPPVVNIGNDLQSSYVTNEPPTVNIGNDLQSSYVTNEPPVINIGNDLTEVYPTNEPPVINIGNDLDGVYTTNEPPVVNVGNNLTEVYTTNEPPVTNVGNDLDKTYPTNEPQDMNVGNNLQTAYNNETQDTNTGNPLGGTYPTNEPPSVNVGNDLGRVYGPGTHGNVGNPLGSTYVTNNPPSENEGNSLGMVYPGTIPGETPSPVLGEVYEVNGPAGNVGNDLGEAFGNGTQVEEGPSENNTPGNVYGEVNRKPRIDLGKAPGYPRRNE